MVLAVSWEETQAFTALWMVACCCLATISRVSAAPFENELMARADMIEVSTTSEVEPGGVKAVAKGRTAAAAMLARDT